MKQNKANLLKAVRDSNIKGAEVHADKFRDMNKIEEIIREGIEAFTWSDGVIIIEDAVNRITEDITTLIQEEKKKAVEGFVDKVGPPMGGVRFLDLKIEEKRYLKRLHQEEKK